MVRLGAMGLLISFVVPMIMLGSRRRVGWDRAAVPAAVAAPVLVGTHALYTALVIVQPPALITLAVDVALLGAAVLFWLPVIGMRRRCTGPGLFVYLFLTLPFLDVAAVYLVSRGHVGGGLAMLVGMLPLALAAIGVVLRWLLNEERQAQRDEEFADLRPAPATDRQGAPARDWAPRASAADPPQPPAPVTEQRETGRGDP